MFAGILIWHPHWCFHSSKYFESLQCSNWPETKKRNKCTCTIFVEDLQRNASQVDTFDNKKNNNNLFQDYKIKLIIISWTFTLYKRLVDWTLHFVNKTKKFWLHLSYAYAGRLAWRSEPKRWTLSPLFKLSLNGQTDRVCHSLSSSRSQKRWIDGWMFSDGGIPFKLS